MDRPHPLSVVEAAAELNTSEAYVRRLLISRRLHGIKVGPVWAIYREDLEMFRRLRRPPGRPRKPPERQPSEIEERLRVAGERAPAGGERMLRQRPRSLTGPGAERPERPVHRGAAVQPRPAHG